mmetsp:Transcript_19364/g.54162  ORF Transcript_19364/g.54162 Transcript_19364/m.54162 type:complete len:96 (-) Transcript_19364:302-589(-)|eukprot:CAMPEP_0202349812 /NCGR_PEP_ID=MMETSP1126-20121109/7144_1 /ASSEMBLY_ACC=CAM_ASM_000457 /TAXON_ID=3047 /ORGANISM="Dunaliella tertiolecta, Strain CCMP1320" /LENGTH=95 /DNA_ID=CAMNT_0048941677 /DNA_START=26 /DNA_END=313 /DNA_ORIENTATION=-
MAIGSALAGLAAGLIPGGKVGVAIKVGMGLICAAVWTSGPGAEDASDFKANHERRRGYNRHYALKGRGRKESFRQNAKEDGARLMPKRPFCEKAK